MTYFKMGGPSHVLASICVARVCCFVLSFRQGGNGSSTLHGVEEDSESNTFRLDTGNLSSSNFLATFPQLSCALQRKFGHPMLDLILTNAVVSPQCRTIALEMTWSIFVSKRKNGAGVH